MGFARLSLRFLKSMADGSVNSATYDDTVERTAHGWRITHRIVRPRRTPLQGWYLRRDETVGVDTAGEFYVLTAPPSLTARFRGVQPVPQDPPLVIGAGGKDGESIDLPDALARVLAGEV